MSAPYTLTESAMAHSPDGRVLVQRSALGSLIPAGRAASRPTFAQIGGAPAFSVLLHKAPTRSRRSCPPKARNPLTVGIYLSPLVPPHIRINAQGLPENYLRDRRRTSPAKCRDARVSLSTSCFAERSVLLGSGVRPSTVAAKTTSAYPVRRFSLRTTRAVMYAPGRRGPSTRARWAEALLVNA